MARRIKFTVEAAKWFDRVNGNTYHACRITRTRDAAVLCCPLEYGGDSMCRQTALEAMARAKWLPPKYRGSHQWGGSFAINYERENDYPIHWIVTEGLKRDAVALGTAD